MGSREYEARRSSSPGSEKAGTTVGESGTRGKSARDSFDAQPSQGSVSQDSVSRDSDPGESSSVGGEAPRESGAVAHPPHPAAPSQPPPQGSRVDARIFASDAGPASAPLASAAAIEQADEIEPHVAITFNAESESSSLKRMSSAPPSRPNIAGRYRLDERLAEGGMGIIYAGWHVTLDQPVAVKVIRKELVNNADAVQRFIEEARALAQLRGPHVAQVLDAGIEDGSPFIVMELLRGKDLRTLLEQQGQVPLQLALQLVREACEAVAEAHAKGIVHRDLKPENLFLSDNENGGSTLKVIDFGISARQGADGRYDSGSLGPGSPEYMAPEQLLPGSLVDHRADIWSLGVVLFELLTGYVPFGGNSQHEICSGVVAGEPPLLRPERPEIPESLEELVLRCLNKSADERFSNALELAAALAAHQSLLERAEAMTLELAQEDSSPAASAPGMRGRRRLALGVAFGGVLGVIAYFVSLHTAGDAPQAGPTRSSLVEKSRDLSRNAPQGPEVVPVTDGPNVLPVLGDELPAAPNALPKAERAGTPVRHRPAPATNTPSDKEIDEELEDIGHHVTPLVTSGARSGEEAVEARYALAASKPQAGPAVKPESKESGKKNAEASSESKPSSRPAAKAPPSTAFPDSYE